MPTNKRRAARDIRRTPTVKTLEYIQALIAYKRTHIEREHTRLSELKTMQSELLAIVK